MCSSDWKQTTAHLLATSNNAACKLRMQRMWYFLSTIDYETIINSATIIESVIGPSLLVVPLTEWLEEFTCFTQCLVPSLSTFQIRFGYSTSVGVRSSVINPSVSVCLSLCEHISGTAAPIGTKFCVQIPCGCGSVLLWWRYATLCNCSIFVIQEGQVCGTE